MPSRIAVAALVVAAIFAAPVSASAATLKGQVVGSPYVADAARTAVPVLFTKESARKARLKSPLGLAIVPRRVALTGGILPGRLRTGDRFTASARIGEATRREAFPRVALKGTKITKRAKELSTAELEELLQGARKEIARLGANLTALGSAVSGALKQVDARVAGLEGQVGGLVSELSSVRASVAGLTTALSATASSLEAKIGQVETALQAQITTLLASVDGLTAALGSCTAPATVLGRVCAIEDALAAVNLLDVDGLTGRVSDLSSALTGVVGGLTGLSLTGDLPAALTAQITGALGQLAGLQGTVSTLGGDVAGLLGSVGSIDVGQLNTTLGNLVGALGADPSGLNPTYLQSLVTTANANIATLTGLLGGVDVGALATSVTNGFAAVNGTLGSICSATVPVLGSLPLVGSVNGLLSAQLSSACS